MTMLIEKYLRYLRYERNYSSHTEISYSLDLRQFSSFLEAEHPSLKMQEVDGDIIRAWIVTLMDDKISARSVNRKLSTLKSFYRYLIRIGEITKSPLRNIIGPKSKKALPSFVNYADMAKVLDDDNFDNEDFESVRDHVMLELFYVTGMRRAELIGLKDIDFDQLGKTVKVTGKRNKQRLIPVDERMAELLTEYLSKRDEKIANLSGYLFVKKDGEMLYPGLVYRIVTRHLQWISTLSKTSPHVLRHSFATGMLNNGADINAVKDLLGHSSLASTEVYTHTSFEELKKVYNKAHPRA